MKDNNEGFSLVELIVVIAIMAVLAGMVGTSIAVVSSRKVSNAAASTKEMLSVAQAYSKNRSQAYLEIVGESDGSTSIKVWSADSSGKMKLGDKSAEINESITVKVYYQGMTSPVTVSDGVKLKVSFIRTTGGFDKSAISVPGESDKSATPIAIEFTNGKKTVKLNLATYTGLVTYAD